MKTPLDPRHKHRQDLIQELFRADFHTQKISEEAQRIFDVREKLDTFIQEAAPEFPVDKINKVDLAILRLAVYEMTMSKSAPKNVIIDEAIELAKEFGGESSPAFVNGALGKLTSYDTTS